METFSINRSEFPVRKVLLVTMIYFAALLLTLHLSCFTFKLGCPCIGTGKHGRKLAMSAVEYGSIGIYAFRTVPSVTYAHHDSAGSGSSGLKPWYIVNFSDDEVLLPSNPNLRKLWTTKYWRSKVSSFSDVFQDMMNRNLLKPCDKALCIGAGQGHEVLALKELGVLTSIGIDLVASPPLVMKGNMHSQPFKKDTFDFEFSNVYDHALFTSMFAAEIERTLKPGGIVAIHLMLNKTSKEASAYMPNNNLQSTDVLISLFKNFDVVHVGGIDAFGLNTEVILKKRFHVRSAGQQVWEPANNYSAG